MEERIKKIIFEEREEELENKWIDSNINSLEYVKIIVNLETEFDCEFDDEILLFNQQETIQEFIDRILKLVS
jgi:acyl carrier protein